LYGYFPKAPDAYRENRLMTRSALELERIEYEAGDVAATLEKGEDKRWRLTAPVEEPADQEVVSAFISTLLRMRGESFPAISMAEAGLGDPMILLRMKFKGDDAPVLVRIGDLSSDDQYHYATLDTGVITTVPVTQVRSIAKDLFDFREKRIFEADKDDVQRIEMRFEGTEYIFEKGRRWTVERPDGKIWDSQDDARALVEALARVDGEGVVASETPDDLAPYGLADPLLVAVVLVQPEEGEGVVKGPLTIGDPLPDRTYMRYAMVQGRPEVFYVNQAIVDDVREALKGVRDR
jgi:hypothetical protein